MGNGVWTVDTWLFLSLFSDVLANYSEDGHLKVYVQILLRNLGNLVEKSVFCVFEVSLLKILVDLDLNWLG